MDQNYKGQLNELCQKKGWDRPYFDTKQIGGESHQPIFESTVIVNDFDHISCKGNTKKLAEHGAAKLLLNEILKLKTEHNEKSKNIDTIVMIDGENLHKIVHDISDDDNIQKIIYLSKHHHSVNMELEDTTIKKISPSTRQDGNDYFMAMDMIKMPEKYPNVKRIIIYTRDKFGSVIVDNMKYFYPNIEVLHEVEKN